ELSVEEAWEAIENFAQGQKEWDNPPNIIYEQEVANLKAQAKRLFRNENVWVEMHKEETLGTPIEVKRLDETQLEDLGLNNCNHDLPLSYREVSSFDEPEPRPQPFPSFPSLEVDIGEERGLEPPIKPHISDSFRMKMCTYGLCRRFWNIVTSDASSAVTYTSVYTDSEPWRYYEEDSAETGPPRVIVYGYDGLPIQPVAPPSLDYVPGPEHPPSPDYVPGPEHPPSPVEILYVPEPEYPEYLEPSDDEAPLEDQPLPVDASPIAASPDNVADSDPEEDLKEDP
nr:hypothetical protein [Tanacetum cinerariifolium]